MKSSCHYNLPFSSTKEEYERCLDEIVRRAEQNKSVVALYLVGDPWVPGISDIDIIAVYGNSPTPLPSPWALTPLARKIFTHRFFSFTEDDFTNFFYFYPKPTTNVRRVWGKDIKLKDPEKELTSKDYQLLLAANLVDILINKLLLFGRDNPTCFDVRKKIGEIYSLKYTNILMKTVTGAPVDEALVNDIATLRQQWFAQDFNKNVSDLAKLHRGSLELVSNCVSRLDTFLGTHIKTKPCRATFRNRSYAIRYDLSGNSKISTRGNGYIHTAIPFLKKEIKHTQLILPETFGTLMHAYAAGSGMWSRAIAQSFEGQCEGQISWGEGVKRHLTYTNNVFQNTVDANGLYKPPFSYGVGLFDVRHPYLNMGVSKAIYLLHKIRKIVSFSI